jgi:hypothetical protein
MTTLNAVEAALATKIDGELRFLAPERSVGEYLIEKGYVEVPGELQAQMKAEAERVISLRDDNQYVGAQELAGMVLEALD